ncbi:FhaA domain-containing protein [Streptomyces sp. FXJ1.172]|uniref:FhaA domain-containing protein n=1 Tax=Streptomyces sp. FXJ1.172 TaxID=710705 RepID=UPI0009A02C37|nr:FhaA domain-containing protein [Streptomyces sp. FXJ1.172]WEO93041.1 DUF3662 domain-containing protein [Streptomyces sp. FXJ1.172]
MNPFGIVERAMEQWTSALWDRLPRRPKDPVELIGTLHRHCDENALILDRRRILVPNAFVIELLPDIHRRLTADAEQVAPHLATQIRRHAAERGYTFAGPVAVQFRPAPADSSARFRVHSRIAPAVAVRRPRSG